MGLDKLSLVNNLMLDLANILEMAAVAYKGLVTLRSKEDASTPRVVRPNFLSVSQLFPRSRVTSSSLIPVCIPFWVLPRLMAQISDS